MKTSLIILLFFVGTSFRILAQNFNIEPPINLEKIFMALPDSCFDLLQICVNDSTYFNSKNRYQVINSADTTTSTLLHIEEMNDQDHLFSMISYDCRYSTTLSFTWWNINPERALVSVVVEQVDMCTENQARYFYEISNGIIHQTWPLQIITAAEFISSRVLKANKINPDTPAPVFIRWQPKSDTITASIELGPYLNCPNSYRDSPFIRLNEKQLTRYDVKFCRVGEVFIKCNSRKCKH